MTAVGWVFLDRDGTINAKAPEGEYITDPEGFVLLPGAADAIKSLNEAGIWTGVVTNQRGIALGKMTERDLFEIHAVMQARLDRSGARLDAIYHCPHDRDTCACRKPQPGMLRRAQRDLPELDFGRSAVIGDAESDIEAGRRVGAITVRISAAAEPRGGADHVSASLAEAVEWLLREPALS